MNITETNYQQFVKPCMEMGGVLANVASFETASEKVEFLKQPYIFKALQVYFQQLPVKLLTTIDLEWIGSVEFLNVWHKHQGDTVKVFIEALERNLKPLCAYASECFHLRPTPAQHLKITRLWARNDPSSLSKWRKRHILVSEHQTHCAILKGLIQGNHLMEFQTAFPLNLIVSHEGVSVGITDVPLLKAVFLESCRWGRLPFLEFLQKHMANVSSDCSRFITRCFDSAIHGDYWDVYRFLYQHFSFWASDYVHVINDEKLLLMTHCDSLTLLKKSGNAVRQGALDVAQTVSTVKYVLEHAPWTEDDKKKAILQHIQQARIELIDFWISDPILSDFTLQQLKSQNQTLYYRTLWKHNLTKQSHSL